MANKPVEERRHTVPIVTPIEETSWGKLQETRHTENVSQAKIMNGSIAQMNGIITKMLERLGLIDDYMERDIKEHQELRTGVVDLKDDIGGVKRDTQSSVDTLKFLKTLGLGTAWLLGVAASVAVIVGAYFTIRYGIK